MKYVSIVYSLCAYISYLLIQVLVHFFYVPSVLVVFYLFIFDLFLDITKIPIIIVALLDLPLAQWTSTPFFSSIALSNKNVRERVSEEKERDRDRGRGGEKMREKREKKRGERDE